MNNQEILDNAPEGATHVDVIGQYWLRFNGYRNKRWNKISMEWMPSPNCNLTSSLADIAKIAELEKEQATLLSCLLGISNRCIGEIAMNHRLDAQMIGESIYAATGKALARSTRLKEQDL